MALLEERKKKLAAEGLFDDDRKKELPYLPGVIGVVTSPTGAVIRDILHRLNDRFPRHVYVWPVRVQGEKCAEEVAAGIRGFNALAAQGELPRPDLIIVARGGGSLEDLWGFNEEIVVRAAAESEVPLISAVGHETDWTLIDYAADWRAPTPTAAAERAVPVRADLLALVADHGARQSRAVRRAMEQRQTRVTSAARALPRPDDVLALARQRFDGAAGRLVQALRSNLQQQRGAFERISGRVSIRPVAQQLASHRESLQRLSQQANRAAMRGLDNRRSALGASSKLLASLSYQSVVQRGFAVVRAADGSVLETAEAANKEGRFSVQFQDDSVSVVVDGTDVPTKPARQRPAKPGDSGSQGNLF